MLDSEPTGYDAVGHTTLPLAITVTVQKFDHFSSRRDAAARRCPGTAADAPPLSHRSLSR